MSKKLNNEDFRLMKLTIREKYNLNNIQIMSSDYFQYFDEDNPKCMHSRQNHFLQIAAKVAMHSVMNHKHGAVIVHKKNVIATGYNYHHGNGSIHAEVAALSRLRHRDKSILSECEMYVVRIAPDKFDNIWKYSKPCNCCQNYIVKKCIKRTYYSTNYDFDSITSMIRAE